MTRLLTNALVARLKDQLEPAGVKVYDGHVPTTPNRPKPKYVVIYPRTVPMARDRMAPVASVAVLRWQTTAVGLTRDNAQALDDLVTGALAGVRLIVPGWAPSTMQRDEEFSAPIRGDDTVTPAVFYAISQYLLTATAVPASP